MVIIKSSDTFSIVTDAIIIVLLIKSCAISALILLLIIQIQTVILMTMQSRLCNLGTQTPRHVGWRRAIVAVRLCNPDYAI